MTGYLHWNWKSKLMGWIGIPNGEMIGTGHMGENELEYIQLDIYWKGT